MNNRRKPKIACFAGGNPRDIQLWSGTPYHALQALERHVDIAYVETQPFPEFWHKLAKIIRKATSNKIDIRMLPLCVKVASAASRRRLKACGADVYISFAASGMASMLDEDLKQILVSDATSIAIAAYYPDLENLWGPCRTGYVAMEREAMRRAQVLTYPSYWAGASAEADFAMESAKIAVLPWGPNGKPPSGVTPRTFGEGPLRLLFVGIDWQRKGGDIAITIAQDLNARGIPCVLDVVGVDASATALKVTDHVTFHGRLSKSVPRERDLLESLFAAAHLFVLPTKAEALGMVFAEAAAVGLPSISYATGGVETVVKHDHTGVLLPEGSTPQAFADAIDALVSEPARYEAMSCNAIADSRQRLNWDVWAEAIRKICETL